jgi:PAS domain S-box-containing protein
MERASQEGARRGRPRYPRGVPSPSPEEVKSAILESITDAFLALDHSFRFTYVNRRAEALLGRARAELLGRVIWEELPALVGSDLETALRHAVTTRKPAQLEGRWPGGDAWLETSAYPSYEGLSLYFRDASARRRMQEELEVNVRELARSNQELEHFAYVASHDLQEPLRMVVSYMELFEQKYKGHIDEKADRYIGYAVDGARRMQQLINDLLAYSRLRREEKDLAIVESGAALDAAIQSLESAIAESGAVITRGELPRVKGDPLQLGQLFQNLVGNAIKFRGEVQPRIRVTAEPDGAFVRFAVEDNGIGIAPEFNDKIFVIFQRLHSRAQYGGTGIGLAIARKIVERHGGRIWVESTPGHGATFHFTLPAPGATPS